MVKFATVKKLLTSKHKRREVIWYGMAIDWIEAGAVVL